MSTQTNQTTTHDGAGTTNTFKVESLFNTCKVESLFSNYFKATDTECDICKTAEVVGDDIIVKLSVCGHVFHYNCINTWIVTQTTHLVHPSDGTCPMCRRHLVKRPASPALYPSSLLPADMVSYLQNLSERYRHERARLEEYRLRITRQTYDVLTETVMASQMELEDLLAELEQSLTNREEDYQQLAQFLNLSTEERPRVAGPDESGA